MSDLFCKPHQACCIPLGGLEETAFHFSNLSNLSNAEIRSAHPCFLAALPCLSRGQVCDTSSVFLFSGAEVVAKTSRKSCSSKSSRCSKLTRAATEVLFALAAVLAVGFVFVGDV